MSTDSPTVKIHKPSARFAIPEEQDDSPKTVRRTDTSDRLTLDIPTRKSILRPDLFSRDQSSRSISEAIRLLRSSEEQETLLGAEDLADDDGCFPPRENDDPQAPNPHSHLPIYTTIHRIRRLIIASIGA